MAGGAQGFSLDLLFEPLPPPSGPQRFPPVPGFLGPLSSGPTSRCVVPSKPTIPSFRVYWILGNLYLLSRSRSFGLGLGGGALGLAAAPHAPATPFELSLLFFLGRLIPFSSQLASPQHRSMCGGEVNRARYSFRHSGACPSTSVIGNTSIRDAKLISMVSSCSSSRNCSLLLLLSLVGLSYLISSLAAMAATRGSR